MLSLTACQTTSQTKNDTELRTALITLPSVPKRRVKNVDLNTIQGLAEYIKYQDNYIIDLENYCVSVQKIVDILNRNMAVSTAK